MRNKRPHSKSSVGVLYSGLVRQPRQWSRLFSIGDAIKGMVQFALLQYLLLIITTPPPCNALMKDTESVRDRILNNTFENYKQTERPTEFKPNESTRVMVYMKVLSITSVDVRNMQFTTDVYLRQVWNDDRLAWNNIEEFKSYNSNIVSPSLKSKIWLPDLFFRNGKEGYLHKMTLPNYLLRIEPNGKVLYSQKITMRFGCQMHLETFPMDKQKCEMDIGSYGYTADQLQFYWRKDKPMVLDKNLRLSEFDTPAESRIKCIDCTEGSSTSTGRYTCIKVIFPLERQIGSYLASTYIPNTLIIMVSWLNFWVSVDATPARVALGLLTLLGILTQASTVSQTLPKVSYIKAIDIWTIICIMFIIGVLVEFAVASTLARRNKSDAWQNEVRVMVRQELSRWCATYQQQQIQYFHPTAHAAARMQLEFCEELESLLAIQENEDQKKSKKAPPKPTLAHSEVDVYSRLLFPSCFVLYNLFYWSYYLVLVNNEHDKENS